MGAGEEFQSKFEVDSSRGTMPKVDLWPPVISSSQGSRRLRWQERECVRGMHLGRDRSPQFNLTSFLPLSTVSPARPRTRMIPVPSMHVASFQVPLSAWALGRHRAGACCPSSRGHPVSLWETVAPKGQDAHPKVLPKVSGLTLSPPCCPSLLCLHLAQHFPGVLADVLTPAHPGI